MAVEQIGPVLSERIIANQPFKRWQDVEALDEMGPIRVNNLKAHFNISAVGDDKGDSHCENDEAEHVRNAEDYEAVSRSIVGPSAGEVTTVQPSFGFSKKSLEITNGFLSTMSIRPPRKTLS